MTCPQLSPVGPPHGGTVCERDVGSCYTLSLPNIPVGETPTGSGRRAVPARLLVSKSLIKSCQPFLVWAEQTDNSILIKQVCSCLAQEELEGTGWLWRGHREQIGAAAAPNSCGLTEDKRQVKAGGSLEGSVLASKTLFDHWEAQKQKEGPSRAELSSREGVSST